MVFYAVFILVLVAIVATAITTFEVANNHGTTTSTASVSATVLYSLIFNQTGTCDNLVTYIAPWAVVLNNKTEMSQPPNLDLQKIGDWAASPANKGYSEINFSVPDGTYRYVVYPTNAFLDEGTVTVQGANKVVQVGDGTAGCTAEQSTSYVLTTTNSGASIP